MGLVDEIQLGSDYLDELNSEKIQPNEFSFKLVYIYFDHLFSAENFSDDCMEALIA